MKGNITVGVIIALSFLAVSAIGGSYYVGEQREQAAQSMAGEEQLGAFGDPFISLQLAASPQNSYILSTDGTDNSWIPNVGGGSSLHVDGTGFVYPQTGDYHSAPHYVATSTTATSTFAGDVTFDGVTGVFWDVSTKRLSIGDDDNTLAINGAAALGSKLSTHVVGVTDVFDITAHSHNDTALFGSAIGQARSRGTEASPTIVQDDDTVSRMIAYGFDGTDYAELSRIDTYVDGAPSDGTDMPGRMVFATTPDGSGTASDRLIIDSAGRVGIDTLQADMIDTFTVTGDMNLIHTAVENDDHAFEIDLDAAGFGDVKAVDIVYTTGALSTGEEEAVILLNIDESAATGGDVVGLEILATEGGLDAAYGMKTGIGISPILSKTGTFGNVTVASTTASGSTTVAFNSSATDVTMFASDNDVVVVGGAAQFDEIEFLLDTVASGAGIAPTFEFSTGAGTWTTFSPIDGTNGMKNTGIIDFELADIPTWATGADGNYLIRITRTRNTLATAPIEDKVQIVLSVEYKWDLNGDILVRTATATNIAVGGDIINDFTGTGLSVTGGTLNAEVQTSDLHDAVTLAGTPDYITLSGQTLTRGTVDIGDDTNLAAGNALTLTGDSIAFDGGASPAGELGGTWASPTIDDSLAVSSWNLTTPTFTTNFTFDSVTVTGLSGADTTVITGTAGTSGNCAEWNADGDLVGSGDVCGGGGAAGGVATTSDLLGNNTNPEDITYSVNDFMIGGSATTSAEFLFDPESATFEIASTAAATTTILSTDATEAVRIGEGDADGFLWAIGEGIEFDFGTAGDVIMRGIGSVAEWVTDLALTISGALTATGAVDFSGATDFEIPNGANPTTNVAGEMALDTTDNQLIVDDGTNDMIYRGEDVIFKVTIASTSVDFVSGGIIPLPPEKDGFVLTKYRCYVVTGTSVVVHLSDGTNDTETITCLTTLTSDDDVATNDTFTAGELAEMEIGTVTGSVDYLSFTAYGHWTRE